jgi:glycosyltransferase involved in cell wall biosynthesis
MTSTAPQPKVSVIIAVYNSARFLKPCLDSLLVQTLLDFELICVDDGSTDASGEILASYAQKDSRVRVIHQANSGAGVSRNRGMHGALGEYLIFLDSDDFFHDDVLEKAYGHAHEKEADICLFRAEHFDQQSGTCLPSPWTLKVDKLPSSQPFSWRDVAPCLFQICQGWAWDKLFKTSFVRERGLSFPDLRNSEDGVFVYSALSCAERIVWLDDILVTQREYSNSLSKSRSLAPCAFYEALLLVKESLQSMGSYSELEQSFVNWALDFSLWNVLTISPDLRRTILAKLEKEGWDQLGITGRSPQYFYSKKDWKRYQSIRRCGVDWQPKDHQSHPFLRLLLYRFLASISRGDKRSYYLKKLGKLS